MINHKKVHYSKEFEKFAKLMDISVSLEPSQLADPKIWEEFTEFTTKVALDNDKIPQEEDLDIQVGKYVGYLGTELPYCVIRPKGTEGKKLPCLWFLHGGNWLSGYGIDVYNFLKLVVRELGCCAVSNEYTGREIAAFPAAVEDCYKFGEHIWDYADDYGIDRGSFVLGGESAGGNLAAACVLMLRDRNSRVKLTGQCVIAPPASDKFDSWSHRLWGTEPPAPTTQFVLNGLNAYIRDGIPEGMISYIYPLKAESFANLPPAYVEAGDNDTLASDTIMWATKLALADVPVMFVYSHDTIHGAVTAVRGPYSDKLLHQRFHGIRRLLEKKI